MCKKVLTSLLILFFCLKSYADNAIKIIPDSSNQYIKIEFSRNHAAIYQVILMDDTEKVLYKSSTTITPDAQIISIDWKDYKPGFYHVVLKSKKEKIKLLFIKNDEAQATN